MFSLIFFMKYFYIRKATRFLRLSISKNSNKSNKLKKNWTTSCKEKYSHLYLKLISQRATRLNLNYNLK